jgi:aspartyl protease family protein
MSLADSKILLFTMLLTGQAWATDVSVTGLFTGKAMVSIDGGRPRVMSTGQSIQGVKLLSADSQSATFEINGVKQTLRMGQAANLAPKVDKSSAILSADHGGQFFGNGSVNGSTVRFLVDTGASYVAINSNTANRIGLDYRSGEKGALSTANGVIPVYKVTLNQVRLGDISLNMVEGVVVEGQGLPVALLGMSFLNRTEMKRDGDRMVLTQRY